MRAFRGAQGLAVLPGTAPVSNRRQDNSLLLEATRSGRKPGRGAILELATGRG